MWFPNAWFSKIGLLAVGALLWGGGAQAAVALSARGAQAGTSLKDLSEAEGVNCKKGELRSCLIYYYLVEPDVNGELKGFSDGASGSALSPRLEKVYVLLDNEARADGQELLYEFIEEELKKLRYVPTGNVEVDAENKERVEERWAMFGVLFGRLEREAAKKDTVFGYRQDDLSLDDTLGEVSQQLDSSLSKESNLRELIIRWTNFMLPMAATLAALGLVWAGFLYITSFQDESRLEEAKKVILMVIVGVALVGGSYAIVSTIVSRAF